MCAPDPVSRACSADFPAFGGPISAICAAPSGRITSAGPLRAAPPFRGPSSSSDSSLMRCLMSAWRWSVPLCLGMVRSISRRESRRSRGSRALRNAASAALYSGERFAGMAAAVCDTFTPSSRNFPECCSSFCRPDQAFPVYVFRKRRSDLDFSFTQDQETLRAHLNELLDEVCPPQYAERCDNEAHPPREAYDALGKHGWFSLIVPPEWGGSGGSAIDLAILLEEAGRHFEELGTWLFRTLTYGGYPILTHGTQAQKEALLPRLVRGELSVCFGLTEPHSGSDAAALTTKATAVDGGYVINGQKIFTSGMDISDYCVLITRTATGKKKQQGITNFLVDTRLPDIEIRKIKTMGTRAIGTTQVFYTDVKVPASAVLGEVDRGWGDVGGC